jgi:hypothetical protein
MSKLLCTTITFEYISIKGEDKTERYKIDDKPKEVIKKLKELITMIEKDIAN